MQTLKSFTFIVLLCGSFSVLSDEVCQYTDTDTDAKTSIANSKFTSTSTFTSTGTCSCKEGYVQSEGDNWDGTTDTTGTAYTTQGDFDFGTCTENVSSSTWKTPLAIGGGIVAAGIVGGVGAAIRYKYNFLENESRERYPDAYPDALTWVWSRTKNGTKGWVGGNEQEYLRMVFTRKLEGAQKLEGLTNQTAGSDLADQEAALRSGQVFRNPKIVQYDFNPYFIKYDPVTGKNVLVDSEDRLFARWNDVDRTWDPAEGAMRWRYSNKFGYRVVATSDDNFYNPNTGVFEREDLELFVNKNWGNEGMGETYLTSMEGARATLEGAGDPLEDLRVANANDKDIDAQITQKKAMYKNASNSDESFIRYDASTDENILVDRNNRLLARWDAENQKWTPADGASRWRMSKTFKYKIVSNNDTNFYDPQTGKYEEIAGDSVKWEGTTLAEYKINPNILKYEMKGAGEPMDGLTDANSDDIDFPQQRALSDSYDFTNNKNIHIKYNPSTNKNVVVDDEDRLMANWDENQKEWVTVDGSDRWTWNNKLGHSVIAKNENGDSFLNPNTGEFEVNGVANEEDWEQDFDAANSVRSPENLEGAANAIKGNRITIQASIEENKNIPSWGEGDDVDFSNFSDFSRSFGKMEEVSLSSEEIELGELGPDSSGGAGCGFN